MSEEKDQVVEAQEEPQAEQQGDIAAETAPEADKIVEDPETPPEVELWDKADLYLVCGNCGTEEKITEAIGGVNIFMATKSDAETRLVCNKCGNKISLMFRDGSMMTEEEKEDLRKKQIEQQEEALKAQAEAEAKDLIEKEKEYEPQEASE